MTHDGLWHFIVESNRIESIIREPTPVEIGAHRRLLALPSIGVSDLEGFVGAVAGAELRRRRGQDVIVGGYRPPPGSADMDAILDALLELAQEHRFVTPHRVHVEYELLHPFMDGNGRSGRALWAWQMHRAGRDPFRRGFLHEFYYQTLDAAR